MSDFNSKLASNNTSKPPTEPYFKPNKMKTTLRTLLKATKPTPLNLEVESKFIPTTKSLHQLRTNSGTPPFATLQSKGTTHFKDEYYDRDARLEHQSIWIRLRNGAWEAKTRTAGDTVHATYEEVAGERAVAGVVHRAAGLRLHELQRSAALGTAREAWLADARFLVVVDVADFGHRVGEVEVVPCHQMPGLEDADALRAELVRFMDRYRWAFPGEGLTLVGKLEAYFRRFPPQ